MLDEEEQEAPMPATDHVAEAKFQFADNLRRIQLASRDLGTRGTSSFDLLKKVQFSEDEVRSLIREVFLHEMEFGVIIVKKRLFTFHYYIIHRPLINLCHPIKCRIF